MIKFNNAIVDSDGFSFDALIQMAERYPNVCYVVDADNGVIRMAEND